MPVIGSDPSGRAGRRRPPIRSTAVPLRRKPARPEPRAGGAARESLLRGGMTNFLFVLAFMTATPADSVVTPTVVDRIEESEWLVLDVPPHPSLPVPLRLAPSLREGDALTVTVTLTVVGAFSMQGLDSRGLVLGDDLGTFHWPEALAPAMQIGDRVDFRLTPRPVPAAGDGG